jgi:hypothetical protein
MQTVSVAGRQARLHNEYDAVRSQALNAHARDIPAIRELKKLSRVKSERVIERAMIEKLACPQVAE